jgi:hypothetical protein
MTPADDQGLSPEEIAAQDASALPDREAMSTIPTSLLNIDANIDAALHLAAPIDAGVAANANAALPIDGAVSANALSEGGTSIATAPQDSAIGQSLDGTATASAHQASDIGQGAPAPAPDTTTPGGQ